MAHNGDAITLAVGGGKGGVGKSMICSNLAVIYAQEGIRVALFDLDFGAANIHTVFGIRTPEKDLGSYFEERDTTLKELLLPTEIPNLHIIAASGCLPKLTAMPREEKAAFIKEMQLLDVDIVLLDLGAGSAINILDFFSMTTAGIVVTTPEPTAILNAYEFLKNTTYHILSRMFRNHPRIIKQLNVRENSIQAVIERIAKMAPWVSKQIDTICRELNFYLIFNQAQTDNDATLGKKLHNTCSKHLNIYLNYAGILYHSKEVHQSLLNMRPITLDLPDSATTISLRRMAHAILNNVIAQSVDHTPPTPFEKQYATVLHHAKKDYLQNLLTNKRLEREQRTTKYKREEREETRRN
ncbi:P-loop NTPase [Simkania negevensis]|uniref:P-loop NTPase n=1 Tax=Simkania negevensis TaxID=83561 RepID=A0ABS3ARI4_9BACT|nr:P-loop NTPase [Simkania negevensis]